MSAPDGREKAFLCTQAALDKKASDLVIIDVSALTSLTEYIIVCTGRSDRQVQAIAEGIHRQLRDHRVRPLAIEGATRGQWALMDYDDVIVHVFYKPVREFYDLERLWEHAPRVPLPEPLRSQALGTGDRAAEL